jgi:hypothetical protein
MTTLALQRMLAALLLFVGLGGLFGGLLFVTDPSGGSMGMDAAILAGSPFADFLVPGVVLLLVNGVGSTAAGAVAWMGWRYTGQAGAALGALLVAWILIQIGTIGFFWAPPFQPLFLVIGLAEVVLGVLIARRA